MPNGNKEKGRMSLTLWVSECRGHAASGAWTMPNGNKEKGRMSLTLRTKVQGMMPWEQQEKKSFVNINKWEK